MATRFDKLLKAKSQPKKTKAATRNTAISKKTSIGSGKRSDDNFIRTSVLLPKDTHRKVKTELLIDDDRDMSDLIGDLLIEWLNNRK